MTPSHTFPDKAESERDRPSRHGAILGEALAALDAAGRDVTPIIPEKCLTCAFRLGSMPNQMAATGLLALNCTLEIDKDRFACHHGMDDGRPNNICGGYLAAKRAPFAVLKVIFARMQLALAGLGGPDPIRAAYDAWIAGHDPENQLDEYQRARAYAKACAAGEISTC